MHLPLMGTHGSKTTRWLISTGPSAANGAKRQPRSDSKMHAPMLLLPALSEKRAAVTVPSGVRVKYTCRSPLSV